MKTILYTSPYVPPEWIAAHGLEPVRLIPDQVGLAGGPVKPLEGTCPFMRLFTNAANATPGISGIVLTTSCDQMRHAKDILERETTKASFLMNVPAVWQTPASDALYRSELSRLGRFLESVGGQAPSKARLVETLDRYDQARVRQTLLAPPSGPPGLPVALLGGALTRADLEIYSLVAGYGGQIVLDGTEGGDRTSPGRFDPQRLQDDPLGELVSAYIGFIPDVFRRPNSEVFTWLQREVTARGVRGVIVARQVWCDQWHAEIQRLRASLDVPLLDLDLDGEPCGARTRIRIQAFMESLQ